MLAKELNRLKELPTVVIFGRTNVGKSTLFNCLTEKKQALVANLAGTTRDCNIGTVQWQGRAFTIIDTGGLMDLTFLKKSKVQAVTIDELVQKQARQFLTRADLVLFLVDNKDGLLPQDEEMVKLLKKFMPEPRKIVFVVNKVDSQRQSVNASDFYKLNLGDLHLISSTTGAGTGDLLDFIINKLKNLKTPTKDIPLELPEPIKVCILGKPNVGKSSLLNSVLGYDRVLVSPIPHTTREPQDTDIVYKERLIKLIDTAGISKQGKKSSGLEKIGIMKSLDILRQANIVLLIIDINELLTQQDAKLVEEIFKHHKSLIIVANKWDLIETRDTKQYTKDIYRSLPFAHYIPIQFLSALKHTKVNHLLDLILKIDEVRHQELTEDQLEHFIKRCINKHKPTKGHGIKKPRIFKFKQMGVNPPAFVIKIGSGENLADSYIRFISNQLRESFGYIATPLNIWVEKARHIHGKTDNNAHK